jgi:hypothetical protein
MQCAARGLVAFARCAALHRMRCNALRCTGCDALTDALRAGCDAMRCTALHGARIVCDAIRCAGWLHSRGAVGAMLFTKGFLGWPEGWVEEWVDRWVEREGKGGVWV